ncbi:MAG: hypothetical protein M1826_007053 [Phylliscum demangeonii]|nr:MAG: hypothetical protein M1826_007053 [Phylliscum demangeonii]
MAIEHPLDQYGYGQTAKRQQRLLQNDGYIRAKAGERRTRRPKGDGEFTPANDADYEADVQEIQREYQQRMAEVESAADTKNPWAIPQKKADDLKQRAQRSRDQDMVNAYERHDMRKRDWTWDTDVLKRQIARLRYEKKARNERDFRKEVQTDLDKAYEDSHPALKAKSTRPDKILEAKERQYARKRPMPSVAEQKAGFPPPSSPPSSSSSSPPPPPAAHQMALLPALTNQVAHAVRSSLRQLEHAATFLGHAVPAWAKRGSKSEAAGVERFGRLDAEVKAAGSW